MTFNHLGLHPIELSTVTIDGKRYYVTPEGNKYPSVTTVIGSNAKSKQALLDEVFKVGKEKAQAVSNRAAGRGTRYHKLVEDYINNELDESKYRDQPLPWLMFHSSKHVLDRINKVYLQEAALYSDLLRIAGRVDCIAEYDGVLSIIDFKTSRAEERGVVVRLLCSECAYACMLQERYQLSVKQLVTIVACENSDVQVSVVEPKKEYFLRLQEYIQEYEDKHGRKPGG